MIAFILREKTKTLNESFRGDWRARAGTAKRQRSKALKACPPWAAGPLLTVRLTRVSPGTLDDDAVPAALKHVRDGVAARLRVDDASPLVRWEYAQETGAPAVIVQVWSHADMEMSKKEAMLAAALKELRQEATLRRKRTAISTTDAKKHLLVVRTETAPRPAYTPPRPHPAKEHATLAADTFAPPPCTGASPCGHCATCSETHS